MGIAKLAATTYFDELPETTRQTVADFLNQHFDCEVFSQYTESIECRARDGFSPYSHNRGGLVIRGFTDLASIWGSGNYPSHAGACKEIERQIEYSLGVLHESVFEKYKSQCQAVGLTADTLNYSTAIEHELDEVREAIEDGELDVLSDEQSSIMYELRFMYHGQVNGKHTASISAAVNTEGPYHRSHIPWSPSTFCEGSKEIEISWTTDKQLADKLDTVLAKLTKAIF